MILVFLLPRSQSELLIATSAESRFPQGRSQKSSYVLRDPNLMRAWRLVSCICALQRSSRAGTAQHFSLMILGDCKGLTCALQLHSAECEWLWFPLLERIGDTSQRQLQTLRSLS